MPTSQRRLKVLILEDDPQDLLLLKTSLDLSGESEIEWVHASRLAEALEHLAAASFDVLVLDLNVPDSSGLDTFKRVHAMAPETPTVVLSGQRDRTLAMHAVQAGAQDFLVKSEVDGGPFLRALRYAIQRQAMQMELQHLAMHDDLTGLYNRRAFLTLAEQQLRLTRQNQHTAWIFFADVDGLKAINDQYGHALGSLALRDVADILRQTVRESDVVARWGGDEFVVLAIETEPGVPQAITARFEANLKQHRDLQPRPFELSVTIGFQPLNSTGGQTLEQALDAADAAMYARKRSRPAEH